MITWCLLAAGVQRSWSPGLPSGRTCGTARVVVSTRPICTGGAIVVRSLSTSSLAAGAAPVVLRVVIGLVMAAHGWQKLTMMGPANFGSDMLAGLGIPAPVAFGYLVTVTELIGGLLLIVGLLTRLATLPLIVILAVATIAVKLDIGLIAGAGAPMPGAELDLTLIAGLVAVLLLGPGRPSLDHLLGIERDVLAEEPAPA
ncbi:MAG: DoxX family protein [Euzebyaceae bacterium]|nr:DoxX family protein [Euzebyaceae bacterium]